MKIKVTYFDAIRKVRKVAYFTREVLRLWKKDPACLEIMDCETGEILFARGL